MSEHKDTHIWVESPVMKDFFFDVTRTFLEHKGENEIVTFNNAETHGHEPLHSQINLINKEGHRTFKIKLSQ